MLDPWPFLREGDIISRGKIEKKLFFTKTNEKIISFWAPIILNKVSYTFLSLFFFFFLILYPRKACLPLIFLLLSFYSWLLEKCSITLTLYWTIHDCTERINHRNLVPWSKGKHKWHWSFKRPWDKIHFHSSKWFCHSIPLPSKLIAALTSHCPHKEHWHHAHNWKPDLTTHPAAWDSQADRWVSEFSTFWQAFMLVHWHLV